jgi:hypothetical protein
MGLYLGKPTKNWEAEYAKYIRRLEEKMFEAMRVPKSYLDSCGTQESGALSAFVKEYLIEKNKDKTKTP